MHRYLAAVGRDPVASGQSGARPGMAGVRTARGSAYQWAGPKGAISLVPDLKLTIRRAALVMIDPQVDGVGQEEPSSWLPGRGPAARDGTIRNLARLLEVSKRVGMTVAVSLTGPVTETSDVGFLPKLVPFIDDGETVVCRPPGLYRDRINDLGRRLRMRLVEQVVLAGMIDTLPIEAHLREFLEQDFDVAVVRDAVAGTRLPAGDGYLPALVRLRMAHALWTTKETVERLGG